MLKGNEFYVNMGLLREYFYTYLTNSEIGGMHFAPVTTRYCGFDPHQLDQG